MLSTYWAQAPQVLHRLMLPNLHVQAYTLVLYLLNA